MSRQQSIVEKLANFYMDARLLVIAAGYASEIDWQEEVNYEGLTEKLFLQEAGWVILSSGMRESVIRNKFSHISKAFFEWESAEKIVQNRNTCFANSIVHFRHPRKIGSIIEIAFQVTQYGFPRIKDKILEDGISYIMSLPYMGPATSYHLAKNIGFDVSKPDRHLRRITKAVGYHSPQQLCSDIAGITGDKVSVIDLVLWRFATLNKDYLPHSFT